MYYDPKTNKFPYTDITDKHYLKVKKNNGLVFDENYPYIDRSKGFLFKQKLIRILLYILVFPIATVRMGLRIKGRENIKKHKDVLKNGVISCCNHVHMWDYIAVMKAIRPFKSNLLAWAPNVRGENGKLIRLVGGIPIPDRGAHATAAYLNVLEDLLKNEKGWLHIYAEGSMWEYYAPVRPFKRGISYLSIKSGKPVLPLGISYRKAGFIRSKIFQQVACLTLTVGEPVYPNEPLPLGEREKDLTVRCHDAVCRLVGIDPAKNLYPPVFNNDKRIDYYTDVYGVGYKTSW